MKIRGFLRFVLACQIALVCLPLSADKAEASPTTYYIHFRNKDGSQIDTLPDHMNDIPAGQTFQEAFKVFVDNYPEMEDGTTKMTVWTRDAAGTTPIFLDEKVNSNITLYRQTYKPVNTVKLTFVPPSEGDTAGVPNVSIVGSANYTLGSRVFLRNRDDQVPFTGKFARDIIYWLDLSVKGKDGYALNGFTRKLKVLIDGAEVHYDMNFGLGVNIKKPFWIDDDVEAFVRRMYVECLGRQPDNTGFGYWTGMLKVSQEPASTLVNGFFNSAEFKKKNYNDSTFVDKCYRVMFDRNADSGGKTDWLTRLENGVSRDYVLHGFVGSVEFHKLCSKFGIVPGSIKLSEPRDQNYGVTSFIARLYTKALERKFDVKGLNDWCKQILASSNKKQQMIFTASNGFFHSPEFLNKNHSNEKYVTILYRTFLNREPDTGGYNDWLKKLKNGTSRDEVLNGFAYSPEFAKLMAKYGIN